MAMTPRSARPAAVKKSNDILHTVSRKWSYPAGRMEWWVRWILFLLLSYVALKADIEKFRDLIIAAI
jgi:hypothetical protein